jgi:hypothetical protein
MRTHNVEFDYLSLEPNGANLEVDAKCRENFCVGVVHETAEDARLEAKDGELRRIRGQ